MIRLLKDKLISSFFELQIRKMSKKALVFLGEWLTFTHDVVTTTQNLVTVTQKTIFKKN
jgi:hypothetical protein